MAAYLTLAEPAEGFFRDKGSRFIALALHTDSESAVKAALNRMREQHPKASHICYAFRLGADGLIWKAADAGEPAGSAGMPILNTLRSKGLTNCTGIVVRYYGGTKLGIPGLIQAYKTAMTDALDKAKIISKEETIRMVIDIAYKDLNSVLTLLRIHKIVTFEVRYDAGTQIVFTAMPELEEQLRSVLYRYGAIHL